MLEIFNSNNFTKSLKNWYSKFGETKIKNFNGINYIFLNIKNLFKEIIIPGTIIKDDINFENLINYLKQEKIFRIRFLFYNKLFISEKIAKNYGLKKHFTQIIDLNQPLENIFKGFRSIYRNEINKYLKGKFYNLKFIKINSPYAKEFEDFYLLYKNTIQRARQFGAKHLIIEDKKYFENLLKQLNGQAIIYNLYFKNNLINSAIILKDNNGIYYFKGASNHKKEYKKIGGGRILHYEIEFMIYEA